MEVSEKDQEATGLAQADEKDFPYFRKLWKSTVVALIAAALIPMILIGGCMYYYTVSIIREKSVDTLRQKIGEQRATIDEFLSERTIDLKLLASNLGLEHLTGPGALEKVFRSLREQIPCFTDLGIIDEQGNHVAYTGPYDLLPRNYRETPWFKAVKEREVYISDVFSGFRNEPHFIIAVKQRAGEGFWIIRATVDASYFNMLVTEILNHRRGDAFLVNREGLYQAPARTGGRLMAPSGVKDLQPFYDVRVQEQGGQIIIMTWLQRAPWAVVGKFDSKEIYDSVTNVRFMAVFSVFLGGIIIIGTVLLTINSLITRLERKSRSIRFLDGLLQHSSKLSSSFHLASEIIQEMNDTLSNIDLVSSWLLDLGHRNLIKDEDLREMTESIGQIKHEVVRARKATEMFIKATQRTLPLIKEIHVNDLLEEILELLDREIRFNKITINRDFQDPLPPVRSDPSLLRQVFQNLILNAVTAIRRNGRITISTRGREEGVTVQVADTGSGIPKELKEKIFDPLYAARPDGSGLGLSIETGIIRKLGGRISVESEEGKGAVCTVDLPSRFQPDRSDRR